jgi:hypothetical protein
MAPAHLPAYGTPPQTSDRFRSCRDVVMPGRALAERGCDRFTLLLLKVVPDILIVADSIKKAPAM